MRPLLDARMTELPMQKTLLHVSRRLLPLKPRGLSFTCRPTAKPLISHRQPFLKILPPWTRSQSVRLPDRLIHPIGKGHIRLRIIRHQVPAVAIHLAEPQQPARLLHPQRQQPFSTTPKNASKLGRTPISIPPGVELTLGEPFVRPDPTTYLRIPRRTLTVTGPLFLAEISTAKKRGLTVSLYMVVLLTFLTLGILITRAKSPQTSC